MFNIYINPTTPNQIPTHSFQLNNYVQIKLFSLLRKEYQSHHSPHFLLCVRPATSGAQEVQIHNQSYGLQGNRDQKTYKAYSRVNQSFYCKPHTITTRILQKISNIKYPQSLLSRLQNLHISKKFEEEALQKYTMRIKKYQILVSKIEEFSKIRNKLILHKQQFYLKSKHCSQILSDQDSTKIEEFLKIRNKLNIYKSKSYLQTIYHSQTLSNEDSNIPFPNIVRRRQYKPRRILNKLIFKISQLYLKTNIPFPNIVKRKQHHSQALSNEDSTKNQTFPLFTKEQTFQSATTTLLPTKQMKSHIQSSIDNSQPPKNSNLIRNQKQNSMQTKINSTQRIILVKRMQVYARHIQRLKTSSNTIFILDFNNNINCSRSTMQNYTPILKQYQCSLSLQYTNLSDT
eukprot:TRINITY_DN4893_c0_g2_i1.p1 TRINITY_DN4893_c0_g2~~TRINITY_DN4893_c0_g2_i1.p1  ORF type:complete len:446 (+),score=-43.51 TRINITY_DN4893_c0_g2_i1:137-1339(+)